MVKTETPAFDDWDSLPRTALHCIAQFTINSIPTSHHKAAKHAYLMSTTPDSMNGLLRHLLRTSVSSSFLVADMWACCSRYYLLVGTESSTLCKIHFAKFGLSVNSERTKGHPLLTAGTSLSALSVLTSQRSADTSVIPLWVWVITVSCWLSPCAHILFFCFQTCGWSSKTEKQPLCLQT